MQHAVSAEGEIKPVQVASTASTLNLAAAAAASAANAPATAKAFLAFPRLELKWDKDFLFVGSNGLPDHGMMVGITAWQQQVPLPQNYTGDNAWRIPLHPVPAKTPAIVEGHFLRGAIAIGVNGIPIFNPQNNRGEVSYEIGELDQWGGHCGRADDYHYHIAPLHLQAAVGKGMPIAYALDGYPIYGLTEPDGSPVGKLDECHGHEDANVGYHYHASTKRPYVQSAFHGVVVEAEGQVDPQPRAQGVRPDTVPLRGAEITGFESSGSNGYTLSYQVGGGKRSISYSMNNDGSYTFEYNNGSEPVVMEIYKSRDGGGRGKGMAKGQGMRADDAPRSPPPESTGSTSMMDVNGDDSVTAQEFAENVKREFATKRGGGTLADAMAKARGEFLSLDRSGDGKLDASELTVPTGGFVLTSTEVADGGNLPADYTGDGSGATLPLEWKGVPAGTKSYALIMDHLAPGNEMKSYWVMWDIPANVTSLPKNVKGVGRLGVGFRGQPGYEPPHSKGPGAKTYVLHLYALSAEPKIAGTSGVSREALLAAIDGKILAKADLSVVYTRGGVATGGPASSAPQTQPMQTQGGGQPDGQRKPWMQMHGAELDGNGDGMVTLEETLADMKLAALKYDADKNGVITPAEIDAAGDIREGAAFAGFIYRHAFEVDANQDSQLTTVELEKSAKYLFDSADINHDGKLSAAEVQSAPNAPLGNADEPLATPPPGPEMKSTSSSALPMRGQGNPSGGKKKKGGGPPGLIKPGIADTMKLNVYADNWFMLYVNGRLVAVDPIQFTPHNVVSVDFLPEYPMTIAVLAKDNADPMTGLEYGSSVGDGGFILKFADGTVTNASWKAKNFFHGPINGDTANPQVKQEPLPANWWAVDFDDSAWKNAKEYSVEEVDPKQPYFENDFEGAKFIWTDNLALDNTIIFRTKIEKPEWKQRWNTKPDLDVTGAPLK